MPLDPISLSIEASEAGIKSLAGVFGSEKDKKEAKVLKATRPKASFNPEVGANLALAESELSNPDAQAEQAWREGSDSALASAIGATLKGGGTPNDVASVFANNEQGRQNLLKLREQIRMQKVGALSGAYQMASQERDKVFDYNSREWFDDAQANAEKTKRDDSLIWSGVSDLGAIGVGAASQEAAKKIGDKTLKDQASMFETSQEKFMKSLNSYFNP